MLDVRNNRKRLAIFRQLKRDKCDIISGRILSKGVLICIKKGLNIRDMKQCMLNVVNERIQLSKLKLEEEHFSIFNVCMYSMFANNRCKCCKWV